VLKIERGGRMEEGRCCWDLAQSSESVEVVGGKRRTVGARSRHMEVVDCGVRRVESRKEVWREV